MTSSARCNPSLSAIFSGELKPVLMQNLGGREYFLFRSGSIRRQIGQGHSSAERKARRSVRKFIQRVNAMKVVWAINGRPSVYASAAQIVSKDPALRPHVPGVHFAHS